MVKKLGKRKRKALAKAKRQKGIRKKFSTDDIITKLLYIGQQLKEIAEEMEVDYISVAKDGEVSGPVWIDDEELTFE
jgi:predicted transposase YdaD|tara:strand:+ start:500 stop:730 length:231 start_codon:yes stop_codon:yes gene_type:complete